MPNNIFYVFDNNKIKVEGMTKEQIYNAIAEATGHTPQDVDSGFITTIVETNKNKPLHFWFGTKAEYEAITTKAHNTLYIFSDDTDIDDLQAAVEELQQVAEQIGDIEIDIQNLQSSINGLDTRVTAAEAHIDEAVEDVDEAVAKVDAMQSAVTQLQTDVDNAETNITALQGTTGTLRNDLNDLGNDVTQQQLDISYCQDHISTINTKNGQEMLIQQVPSGTQTISVPLLGTYGISDFSVVKVRFVTQNISNKEILCNVYHDLSNDKAHIVGTFCDVESLTSSYIDFYNIDVVCDELQNKIEMNLSSIVRLIYGNVQDFQYIGLTIDQITGVC